MASDIANVQPGRHGRMAESSRQVQTSSADLSKLAEQLKSLVNKFQV